MLAPGRLRPISRRTPRTPAGRRRSTTAYTEEQHSPTSGPAASADTPLMEAVAAIMLGTGRAEGAAAHLNLRRHRRGLGPRCGSGEAGARRRPRGLGHALRHRRRAHLPRRARLLRRRGQPCDADLSSDELEQHLHGAPRTAGSPMAATGSDTDPHPPRGQRLQQPRSSRLIGCDESACHRREPAASPAANVIGLRPLERVRPRRPRGRLSSSSPSTASSPRRTAYAPASIALQPSTCSRA